MHNARLKTKRLALLAGLVAGVAALHAWLLAIGESQQSLAGGEAAAAREVDRTAIVVLPAAAVRSMAGEVGVTDPVPPAVAWQPPATNAGRDVAPRAARVMPAVKRTKASGQPPPAPEPALAAVPRPGAAEPPAQGEVGDAASAVPLYPTRPPPAFALRYSLQRGAVMHDVEWRWRPTADGYSAILQERGDAARRLAWRSEGGFDAAGLAPVRYTDRRPGRGVLATNFQRDAAAVTFSGSASAQPLAPGAQDGLSWLLQLAAIAAADPARVAAGGGVTLRVAGLRGEADAWTFEPMGWERIEIAGVETPTLHLRRLPQRAFDTRAEVWLDPARDYLPVRVRWANGGHAMLLQWQGAASAP